MLTDEVIEKYKYDAQGLAKYFYNEYFLTHEKKFPINPFQVLADLGIHFVFRNLDKMEGLFMPAVDEGDIDLVVINAKRPIARQRFTAAHELCHFLKDPRTGGNFICQQGAKSLIEKYADAFASAFLMPEDELKSEIGIHIEDGKRLSYDDILIISEHFGTSFQACGYRILKEYPYLMPDFGYKVLRKYHPAKQREKLGFNDVQVLSDLMDSWKDMSTTISSDFAKNVFKNHYIYNDARLENVDVSLENVAEIVEDIRGHTQFSEYCNEDNEKYCHIAGHFKMYDWIFENYSSKSYTVYDIFQLNKLLFSCFPFPDAGGKFRKSTAIITDSQVETAAPNEISGKVNKLYSEVQEIETNESLPKSEIIKRLVRVHYQLTVIHPFQDGNGRSARGFLNEAFLRYGIPPVYISVERKAEYRDALVRVDKNQDFSKLYQFFFLEIIRSHVALSNK